MLCGVRSGGAWRSAAGEGFSATSEESIFRRRARASGASADSTADSTVGERAYGWRMSALSSTRAEVAARVITAMAGPDAVLRDDQATAVAALCEEGSRVLVVQATGWGKSAV